MDASRTNTRSILIGVSLAAISAGCLIAFSFFAGSADDPTTQRVPAAHPDLEVAPVVVADEAPPPEEEPTPQVKPNAVDLPSASSPVETTVLGTRFRNTGDDNDGGEGKPDPTQEVPPKDPEPAEPSSPHTPTCPCEGSDEREKKKDNSPNGHAYGHDKQPGSSGLARGHDKPAHGNSKGKGNGKGSK